MPKKTCVGVPGALCVRKKFQFSSGPKELPSAVAQYVFVFCPQLLVRAVLLRPDVPSRVRYPALFHTATPDLHMDRNGAVVKRRSTTTRYYYIISSGATGRLCGWGLAIGAWGQSGCLHLLPFGLRIEDTIVTACTPHGRLTGRGPRLGGRRSQGGG